MFIDILVYLAAGIVSMVRDNFVYLAAGILSVVAIVWKFRSCMQNRKSYHVSRELYLTLM